MFLVNSEFYLNDDLEFCPVSVDNYPQKRKNHLTITYIISILKEGKKIFYRQNSKTVWFYDIIFLMSFFYTTKKPCMVTDKMKYDNISVSVSHYNS
jgi:hypothetical protein